MHDRYCRPKLSAAFSANTPQFRCFLLAPRAVRLPCCRMVLTRPRIHASLACCVTLALWWWRGGVGPAVLAGVAAALALAAWVSPPHYAPVQRALDRGVQLVLAALTWLILGVVWLLVFTPLRAFRAIMGSDPLRRTFDRSAESYLRPPTGAASRFDRQF